MFVTSLKKRDYFCYCSAFWPPESVRLGTAFLPVISLRKPQRNLTRFRLRLALWAGPDRSICSAIHSQMARSARIGTTRFCADSSICVAALSPDGRWAAFGTELGRAYVCEAASGKPVFDMQVDPVNARPVSELMFSPDSKTLVASGLWSRALWFIDIASSKITDSFPNTSDEQLTWSRFRQGPCFAFLQNGKSLVVGGKDGAIHIWNIASRTEQVLVEAVKEPVISLTVTSDGRTASAHRDGTLHFWDLVDQKHLRKLDAVFRDPLLTVLSPDGSLFTVETGVGALELRDREGVCRHQLNVANDIVGLAFAPDGSMLRTADTGGIITTWQVSNGKVQASFACEGVANSMASKMNPRPAAWFRPDGKMMAWACWDLLRLWTSKPGKRSPKSRISLEGCSGQDSRQTEILSTSVGMTASWERGIRSRKSRGSITVSPS